MSNAKKPSEMKTIVPEDTNVGGGVAGEASETEIPRANPPEATGDSNATVGKHPTAPDAVTEHAHLGGSTVEEIKGDDEP